MCGIQKTISSESDTSEELDPQRYRIVEDNNFTPLKIFYFNCLLPDLIDPTKKRGLTIRNAPRDTIRDYSELKSY
ncbi:hypothetical protein ILUMI_18900 [Ignelater luminosus]|uniref:Uncharacterized protein n=1 Tax=Ignelater luminosus TaxID=2038154 RepID=A0A8K0CH53_IGNLU|nr:hypothetical protein ILUMI_18900 [Ignelater luminosus]